MKNTPGANLRFQNATGTNGANLGLFFNGLVSSKNISWTFRHKSCGFSLAIKNSYFVAP